MSSILLKKISKFMVFMFLFQIISMTGFAQTPKVSDDDVVNVPTAADQIGNQVNTMLNVPKDAGGAGGYLKKELQAKKDKIVKKLMDKIKSEGMPKVISDLKTLGPLGEHMALEMEQCKDEKTQLETMQLQLDYNIDLLFIRLGELKDEEVKAELDKLNTRVQASKNGNTEALDNEPLIRIRYPGNKGLTEGAGYAGGVCDLGKRLLQVGVGGVVLALKSVMFIVDGLVPLATSLISIVGDFIKLTANFFIDFFHLLFGGGGKG